MAIAEAFLANNSIRRTPQEIYDWIQDYCKQIGIDIVLYGDDAHMKGFYLYIPAYLPDGKDAYDYAVKLHRIENAWNDQEPAPEPPINLISARSPEQRAVQERLWKARERKDEAADAAAEAQGEEEQQRTLNELRAARQEEVQAEKDYEVFYQAKSRA